MKRLKTFFLIMILIFMLWQGGITFATTQEALKLWFEKLVPSMFVSLVLIRCIYHQHMLEHIHIPLLPSLFHVDQATFTLILCIMFLGFPNGALFIDEAYAKKEISLHGARRLLYTCSFAAPAFVILTCGSLLFHSSRIGLQLFLAQIGSGLILLFCTRGNPIFYHHKEEKETSAFMKVLSSAMVESGKALYMIGGYLMLFMSVTSVLFQYLPNHLALPLRIISEFSSGVVLIQQLPCSIQQLQIFTCMLLSFGGFCVHMQVTSMAEHVSFSYKTYILFRIAQSIISTLLFCLFLL